MTQAETNKRLQKVHGYSYSGLHTWIRNTFGTANKCERCTVPAKVYDWANVSGDYCRDRSDWIELCRSCHRKMDMDEEKRARLVEIGKMSKPTLKKAIAQYSIEGKFLSNFDCARTAESTLGILHSSIANNLSGRSNSAGGFIWKYN